MLTLSLSTNATVHISYGYVKRPTQDLEPSPNNFHVRQLTYPVMVTVYQMLACENMNLLTLQEPLATEQRSEVDSSEWCLFSIEVRNLYGQPFEVSFDRMHDGKRTILECNSS